jgi:tRNA A-37 threonylcarbamoyl transferase component Bud32
MVQLDGKDSILGLLLECIDHTDTVLTHVRNGASEQLCQKWARQIEETVTRLHDLDVVWGDVKPDNVLVDSKGDAITIDFGGGFALQWVDRELENTKEGDIQGVSRIRKFLEGLPQRVEQ